MPRQSEIDRMIVMIYRSSNAHDFTNFIRPAGWLDKLPMEGLEELGRMFEVMQNDVEREISARKREGIDRYSREYVEGKKAKANLSQKFGIEFE